MKTKDKQISNRNKITALASTARFRALPPCVLASSTVGSPVQPPSFRTSSLSRRTFLIAKRKIRNCPNSRLFNTLDFSNREKPRFHRFAATGPFLASLPPCILASLIYTPKIRNRRNSRQISHLHFSNLYKSRPFSSELDLFVRSAVQLLSDPHPRSSVPARRGGFICGSIGFSSPARRLTLPLLLPLSSAAATLSRQELDCCSCRFTRARKRHSVL